jgi:hypothetical protein
MTSSPASFNLGPPCLAELASTTLRIRYISDDGDRHKYYLRQNNCDDLFFSLLCELRIERCLGRKLNIYTPGPIMNITL